MLLDISGLRIMGYYGNRELMKRARVLRKSMTVPEIILWSRLRSRKINSYKFRRQQPIFDYSVDFYCHELKFIIEVDGEIHSLPEKAESDLKRDKILKTNGYNILRLTNFEIETDPDAVITKIKSYITTNLSPSHGDHRGSNDEK
ncbi:MAG: endonuclease domain-containing protein [Bacteroidales bacterium]|nr:endonuclease domain-containing protein [Bacteroidales bacterium]